MDKTEVKRQFETKRIARFVVVGVCNAAISFGLLNLCFSYLHQGKITSSIISTTCAVLFSFAMNRNFVFSDKSRRAHHQFLPFVLVTLSGSLVVLNLVYIGCVAYLERHGAWLTSLIHSITHLRISQDIVDINLSTVAGALVAMVWNYNGYRLFVFSKKEATHETRSEAA
jgi:putative flippase GtrA